MSRYDATIEAITPNGYYVTYDSWGNKEEVIVSLFWFGYLIKRKGGVVTFYWLQIPGGPCQRKACQSIGGS